MKVPLRSQESQTRFYLLRPLRALPPPVVIGFLERGVVLLAAALAVVDLAAAALAGFLTESFLPLAFFPPAFFEAAFDSFTSSVELEEAFPFADFFAAVPLTDFLAGTPFLTEPSGLASAFPLADTSVKPCSPVQEVKVLSILAGTLCVSLNDLPKSDCFTSRISSGSLQ